jgi:hypothetical protein
MEIDNIFVKINIINNLKNIILACLTDSHKNILNINDYDFKISEIISKDCKLMNYLLKELDKQEKDDVFALCAKYVKMENMRLLKKRVFLKI